MERKSCSESEAAPHCRLGESKDDELPVNRARSAEGDSESAGNCVNELAGRVVSRCGDMRRSESADGQSRTKGQRSKNVVVYAIEIRTSTRHSSHSPRVSMNLSIMIRGLRGEKEGQGTVTRANVRRATDSCYGC